MLAHVFMCLCVYLFVFMQCMCVRLCIYILLKEFGKSTHNHGLKKHIDSMNRRQGNRLKKTGFQRSRTNTANTADCFNRPI